MEQKAENLLEQQSSSKKEENNSEARDLNSNSLKSIKCFILDCSLITRVDEVGIDILKKVRISKNSNCNMKPVHI